MFLLPATKITVNVFISISAEIIWSIFCHHFFLHTDVHLTRKKMCLPLTGRSEDHLPKPKKKKKGFPEKLLIGVEPIQPHSSVVSQRKICFWNDFKQTRFQCLAPNPAPFDISLIYTLFTLPPKMDRHYLSPLLVIRIRNWPFWTHIRPGYLGSHLWVQTSAGWR